MNKALFTESRLALVASALGLILILAGAVTIAADGYRNRCLPILKWHEEEYAYDSLLVLNALNSGRVGEALRLSQRNWVHPMLPVWFLTGTMVAGGPDVMSFRIGYLVCFVLTVLLIFIAGHILVDTHGWLVGFFSASLVMISGRFCWMYPMGEHPDDLVTAPIFTAGIILYLALARSRSMWLRIGVGLIAALLFFTKYHFAILFMGAILIDQIRQGRREGMNKCLQDLLWISLVPACGVGYWVTAPHAIADFVSFITKSSWVDESTRGVVDWYVQVRHDEPLSRYIKQIFLQHGAKNDYFLSIGGNLLAVAGLFVATSMIRVRRIFFALLCVVLPLTVLTLYPRKAEESFFIFSLPLFLLCGLVAHRAAAMASRIRKRPRVGAAGILALLALFWIVGISGWRAFTLPAASLVVPDEDLRPFLRFAGQQLGPHSEGPSDPDAMERMMLCINTQIDYDVDLVIALYWSLVLEKGILWTYNDVHERRINLREYLRRKPIRDLLDSITAAGELERIDAVWFHTSSEDSGSGEQENEAIFEEALRRIKEVYGPMEVREEEYAFSNGEIRAEFISLIR